MTVSSQHSPVNFCGTLAERAAYVVANIPIGYTYFAHDEGPNGTLYVLSITGNTRSWKKIAGGGGGMSVVTFDGGGIHVTPTNTDIVVLNLQDATDAVLRLPSISVQDNGRSVMIVVVSEGLVEIQPSGTDVLWSGVNTLNIGKVGSSVTVTPLTIWRLTEITGSLIDFTVYVNASTGDDNAAGTSAAPIATVAEAFVRASRLGWYRYGLVYLSSGTFVQPAGEGLRTPSPSAANALPLQLIGTEADSGLSTLTVDSYTAPPNADGPIGATINLAGPQLGLNDYSGWRVRMTGGTSPSAQIGACFMVASNTSTSLMLCDLYNPLNANDTFVLEQPDTTLSFSGLSVPALLFPTISGAQLMLRSLKIVSSAQRLLLEETQVYAQHVWIDIENSLGFRAFSVFGGGEFYAGWFILGWFGLRTTAGFDPRGLDRTGVYVVGDNTLNSIEAREGGIVRVTESVFKDSSLFAINEGFVEFSTSMHSGKGFVGVEGNGGSGNSYASKWLNSVPGSDRGALNCAYGGNYSAENCGLDGVTGSAIKFSYGSSGDVTGCIGGGNSLYGLEVRSGSKVKIGSPTPSVTGTSGNVRVGSPVPAVLWGTAASNANDLAAAATSELCWVGA